MSEPWGGGRHATAERCGLVQRRLDETPRVRLFENSCGKLGVQRVPGSMGDEVADHRVADEGQVAYGVEDLVANELILES